MVAVAGVGEVPPLIVSVDWGAVVWIREVVVVGASGVMVAGVGEAPPLVIPVDLGGR